VERQITSQQRKRCLTSWQNAALRADTAVKSVDTVAATIKHAQYQFSRMAHRDNARNDFGARLAKAFRGSPAANPPPTSLTAAHYYREFDALRTPNKPVDT
jgi:hypothetical protein